MSPAATLSGGMPTRSEVENWPTSHLDEGASRWRQKAAESEELFAQHRQNISSPGGTEWVGDAKDVALDRVTADASVVRRQSDVQREAATIADNGCTDIQAAQRQVLDAIAETEGDGFRVGEDLSVTDTQRRDVSTMAARYTAAREHAEDIRWAAERLVQADTHFGEQLTAKAAELEGIRFDNEGEGAPDNTIQAVDFKQSPIPEPGVPDDPGRGPNPNFPGRDAQGRFLPGNSGALDGAAAAERALQEREQLTGKPLIRQQIRVAIIDPNTGLPMTDPKTGNPLYRFYDALEPTGTPGRYIGVEVKSGGADLSRTQRIFDEAVDSGKPATGKLNGNAVEITDTRQIRAPLYFPGEPARAGDGTAGVGRGAAGGAGPGPGAVAPPPPVEAPAVRGAPPPVSGPLPDGALPYLVDPPGPEAGGDDFPVIGDGDPDGPDL